jgi:UDP-N-acetylglucosamine 1-carboxyvinyltransferase
LGAGEQSIGTLSIMDRIRVHGGTPLIGTIAISGAKNAALPLMAASLLSDEALSLTNLPHLTDIATMAHLLAQHGVEVAMDGGGEAGGHLGQVLKLCAGSISSTEAPYDIVRKMRASVLVLGPLLARCGEAKVSLPGGCAIGTRPIDLHIHGLEQLGAEIELHDGYVYAQVPNGLRGAEVVLPRVSVGASENLLMAAVLARGDSVLENIAREPEVTDLADCLVAMGARIEGIGSDRLEVRGVDRLHGATYAILPDRIEAGTYAMAAAVTGGDLLLTGGRSDIMEAALRTLGLAGVETSAEEGGLRVRRNGGGLTAADVTTEPYPGFPTDLQAQMMALLSIADGTSIVTEAIFENRFMHVPELMRMGADITVKGSAAIVRGVETLQGAPVMATDLRASVSLVLAGLAAEGDTIVNRVYHLDRGYERLEEKLASCGADIERLTV